MTNVPIPDNEEERLKALCEYDLLDTPAEQIFDTVTEIAVAVCGTPISAISLIDRDRQWFKSIKGLKTPYISREVAFCAHTILYDDILEVQDATQDDRFNNNPLVTGQPNIRFYAGVPLKTKEGFNIGSLCVIDQNKKILSSQQRSQLKALSRIIISLFDSRKERIKNESKSNNYTKELETLNAELNIKLQQEKELAHIFKIFNQMYSMLQSCRTIDEALMTIKKYTQRMFPYVSGSLYLTNKETNYLDLAVSWKSPKSTDGSILYDSCWALRRGQPYYSDVVDGLVCDHFTHSEGLSPYLCSPMSSHGETMGVICFEYTWLPEIADDVYMEVHRSFAMRMAEHMALALSNIKLRRTLHEQSIRDPLTNLYNRRYLYDYFKSNIARNVSNGLHPGLMIVDIDFFKKINDEYGHHVGDEVLKQVSDKLKSLVGKGEITARVGGEEFVFVFLGKTDDEMIEKAKGVFENINHFLPKLGKQKIDPVTFSMGLAIYPQDGKDISALLQAADRALYKAKNSGRSKIVVNNS